MGLLGAMLLLAGCTTDTTTPPAGNGDDTNQVCAQVYEPVCGVDGQTYSNACTADVADVAIAYEGECTTETTVTDEPNLVIYTDAGIEGQSLSVESGSTELVEVINPTEGIVRVRIPQIDWEVNLEAGDTTNIELPAITEEGLYSVQVNGQQVATLQVT